MTKEAFQTYVDTASDGSEIGVAVRSIESGERVALSYDVVADINAYGELIICVSVECNRAFLDYN